MEMDKLLWGFLCMFYFNIVVFYFYEFCCMFTVFIGDLSGKTPPLPDYEPYTPARFPEANKRAYQPTNERKA